MENTKNIVITINRELGSGGHTVGKMLAERLGIRFIDKGVIEALVEEYNLNETKVDELNAGKKKWWEKLGSAYLNKVDNINKQAEGMTITTDVMFSIESKILRGIAAEESCVVMGRAGYFIFKDRPDTVKIFIHSDMDKRIARVMKKQGMTCAEAMALIDRNDNGREKYAARYTGMSRYDVRNYDLVINAAVFTEEEMVEGICRFLDKI